MFKGESQPIRPEKKTTLAEIREYLQAYLKNERFWSRPESIMPRATDRYARELETALSDLDRGDFATTLAILKPIQKMLRDRSDEENDYEDMMADNDNANKLLAWINFLQQNEHEG